MLDKFLKSAAKSTVVATVFVGLSAGSVLAELKSETVTYTAGDQELTGYIVYDDAISGKRPGVIVVHEWWGHDEYARTRADKLAKEGYTAFALDMYGTGRLASHPKDAKGFMMEVLQNKDLMHARFKAGLKVLQAHETVDGSKTGALGYCFGGNVLLDMARAGVDLDAIAAFHASLGTTIPATPNSVKAQVKVFNGADDPFINPANLTDLLNGMELGGADFEYVSYPGVLHSFTSKAATAKGEKLGLPLKYDAEADMDSWERTLAMLENSLK